MNSLAIATNGLLAPAGGGTIEGDIIVTEILEIKEEAEFSMIEEEDIMLPISDEVEIIEIEEQEVIQITIEDNDNIGLEDDDQNSC